MLNLSPCKCGALIFEYSEAWPYKPAAKVWTQTAFSCEHVVKFYALTSPTLTSFWIHVPRKENGSILRDWEKSFWLHQGDMIYMTWTLCTGNRRCPVTFCDACKLIWHWLSSRGGGLHIPNLKKIVLGMWFSGIWLDIIWNLEIIENLNYWYIQITIFILEINDASLEMPANK